MARSLLCALASALLLSSASPATEGVLLCPKERLAVYTRPSAESDTFGFLEAGESMMVCARTAGGWLGLQPGVAQAGNIGPFRLRWVRPSPSCVPPDSAELTWVEPLPPRVTYLMAYDDVPVFDAPSKDSCRVGVLPGGDWAALEARLGSGGWYLIRGDGEVPEGWARLVAAGLSGDPDTLPELSD
jgi:hypothetical protein